MKIAKLIYFLLRTPLTIAISRAKADLEKSLDMIRFLVVELKADINKVSLFLTFLKYALRLGWKSS